MLTDAVVAALLVLPALRAQDVSAETEPPRAPYPARVETLARDLEVGTGGLEVDAEGFVYSADFGSRLGRGSTGGTKVLRLDPESGEAQVFVDGLRGASGNAIGPDGAFFQSNIGGNTITRVAPDGTASVFLREGLASPVGIAIDGEGVLFVANCGSNSIVAVTPDGETLVLASDPLLACPNGITLDEGHNLYVANFNNGDVIKVSAVGEVSRLTTLPGSNNGHLVYREGSLYVIARGAHQVYEVSLTGEVELLAGTGARGHHDGPALEATFSYPNDLSFSPDGKILYVNETAPTQGPHTVLTPTTVRRIRLAD